MPVAVHMRDLGAHVSVGAVLCGATLSDRLRKGSTAAKHLRAVPGSIEQKAAVIRGKVLVMSCYGAASTPVSAALLKALRANIARAIDPKAAHNRPTALALNVGT
eukprot:5165217-Alexandrium_andersonii.AAC.1